MEPIDLCDQPFRAVIIHAKDQAEEVEGDRNCELVISDGFNSIQCIMTNECIQTFERSYPGTFKIQDLIGYIISVKQYAIQLYPSSGGEQPSKPNLSGSTVSVPAMMVPKDEFKMEMGLLIHDFVLFSFDQMERFDLFGRRHISPIEENSYIQLHLKFYVVKY